MGEALISTTYVPTSRPDIEHLLRDLLDRLVGGLVGGLDGGLDGGRRSLRSRNCRMSTGSPAR